MPGIVLNYYPAHIPFMYKLLNFGQEHLARYLELLFLRGFFFGYGHFIDHVKPPISWHLVPIHIARIYVHLRAYAWQRICVSPSNVADRSYKKGKRGYRKSEYWLPHEANILFSGLSPVLREMLWGMLWA